MLTVYSTGEAIRPATRSEQIKCHTAVWSGDEQGIIYLDLRSEGRDETSYYVDDYVEVPMFRYELVSFEDGEYVHLIPGPTSDDAAWLYTLTEDLGIVYPGIYDRITDTYELKGTDNVRP
jgi:hypothetical protein